MIRPLLSRSVRFITRCGSAGLSAAAFALTALPAFSDTGKPLPPLPSDEDADEDLPSRLPEVPSDEEDAPAAAEDAEDALPTGHQDCALAILQLLSDTELCLNSCRDAASVQAALPRFRELSERAHRLAEVQRHLPEPTSQDLISMNQHMERFNLLWGAIGDHIHRLEKAGLVSPELRDILRLAPPPCSAACIGASEAGRRRHAR